MTELPIIWDIVLAVLLITGGGFTLAGSLGLLKLNNPMSRLHAPTLASTLGVGSLLLASMVAAFAEGRPSLHEALVMAFLFVTAPITANFIAKVHLHRCRDVPDLPPPPADKVWATRSED
ncbi:multisubunit potassium/proton antiporter, PhaG subunit [Loktanella atrilutea]|uniref:Multisubunit potassium/proton antiporter, PhaG subunit n=1 Tax=Loktanella atrilutea TaxID=366533 RepID=A0A1M5DT19_LOKAT|nr:monovalent cation/H(+) antiporter subunit G [Loktanella atrilutea]SHF70086.1 multisubunit potassium/proton antiporter, PhaG subunit [Loktanella atrilutea]